MEPEYRGRGYRSEAMETLSPRAQETQEREGAEKMFAGRTQEFLFKVFYFRVKLKTRPSA